MIHFRANSQCSRKAVKRKEFSIVISLSSLEAKAYKIRPHQGGTNFMFFLPDGHFLGIAISDSMSPGKYFLCKSYFSVQC